MQQHVEQIFPKCFRWHHKKVSLVAFAQHVSVISNHLISSWMMNYITGSPALISVVIPLRVRLLSPRGKGFIVKWWHKSPHLSALLLLKYCFMGSFFLFDFYSYLLSCGFIIFFPWMLNGTKSTRIYKCRWGSWDKHSLQKCCWASGLAPACRHQVVLLKSQACSLGPVEEKSFFKTDVS